MGAPPGPLTGTTVVEIGHSVAAPFAGLILAELGADVVKVENPDGGDYARGWGPPFWHGAASVFQSLNRDKRGVTVDLRDPEQGEQLRRFILQKADVVVQNLRPGIVERSVIAPDALLREKPTLVYCSIGAYGNDGPLRDKPGYDPLMQAFGGLMSVTGELRGEPVRVGTSIIDMGSGMWAVIGILAALQERSRTGRGRVVDASLYETALTWMTVHVAAFLASGEVRTRCGSGTAEIVPYQAFETADGLLMIAAGNDNLFGRLSRALGKDEWARDERFRTNQDRVVNRDLLIEQIMAVVRAAPTAVWTERLDECGVPCAPIQDVSQVVAHPQTAALGIIQSTPRAEMSLVGLPLRFDGERPPCRRRPPRLGEHNEEVLRPGTRPSAERPKDA